MAKESPPALQCAPPPAPGRALLTAPVGKVRPPMEHVPTGHPGEPCQHPAGGSPGAAPSLQDEAAMPTPMLANGRAWPPSAVPPAR